MGGRLHCIRKNVVLIASAFVLSLCFLSPLWGEDDEINLDKGLANSEFTELPRYCYVQRRTSYLPGATVELGDVTTELKQEAQKWVSIIGKEVYAAVHHYCGGLARMKRYWQSVAFGVGRRGALTARQRQSLLAAVEEFRFMEGRMHQANSVLIPEWAMNWAIAYRELGEDEMAARKFMDAIRAKPNFALPYVELAQLMVDQGNLREARKILNLGLQQTDNAEVIKDKMRSVEGK